jgi:hypothetical protein
VAGHDGGPVGGVPITLNIWQNHASRLDIWIFHVSRLSAAYGVQISQLIRYSRAGGSFHDFFDRGLLLTMKLLNQGLLVVKLKSSFRYAIPVPHVAPFVLLLFQTQ